MMCEHKFAKMELTFYLIPIKLYKPMLEKIFITILNKLIEDGGFKYQKLEKNKLDPS